MSRKEKRRESEMGGPVRKPKGSRPPIDLRLTPEEVRGAKTVYPAVERLATTDCVRLVARFHDVLERYDLRMISVDEFIRALGHKIAEARLESILRYCVLEPLEATYAKLTELTRKLEAVYEAQARQVYREHVVKEEGQYVDKMLGAFSLRLDELQQLEGQGKAAETLLREIRNTTQRLVEQAHQLQPRLQQHASALSEEVHTSHRQLENGSLTDDAALLKCIDSIEHNQVEFRALLDQFEAVQVEYAGSASGLRELHEQIAEYLRRQRLLNSKIAAYSECFVEAGIDQYAASGVSKETHEAFEQGSAIQRCRELLNTPLPVFPQPTRGAELLERATRLCRLLYEESTRRDKQKKTASTVAQTITPLQLAVCVVARLCCPGSPGRTKNTLWSKVLVSQDSTFGITEASFKEALQAGSEQGLLQFFTPTPHVVCWRPTSQGLEAAQTWSSLFSQDFYDRMDQAVAALQGESAQRREARKKK